MTETNEGIRGAVIEAQKGDRDAFRTIFDASNDRVFRYFLGHVRSRENAVDLMQDTFVDLWKALPKFDYRSDEEFWGYLFMIARRKLYAHQQDSRRRKSVALDMETLEALIPLESHEHPQYEDYRSLFNAIAKLTDASREVLTLRYWSELSFKEIAKALRISEGAAKVRHHRAIHELHVYLS
jgi:RNA polymerase sigma-70 factor (ECF subfamily)